MTESATLPTREHAAEENHPPRPAAPLLARSREDCRLAERVGHALRATGYGALRGVQVTVAARVVTLAGRVPSYHLKQVAQTAALAVPGAHQIRNGLDVARPA